MAAPTLRGMKYEEDGPWWETYLTLEEWANMPASRRMWYEPHSSVETEERLQTAHEMGLVLQGFILSSLTSRQRQVVELYFFEERTQVEVAHLLGISQATVSQHLIGKLRGSRHVGGAFLRLRKAIRKAAMVRAGQSNRRACILSVFDELLDSTITRRRARELISLLARKARKEFKQKN